MNIQAQQSRYFELADSADKAIAEENWPRAEHLITEALRQEPSAASNVMLLSNLGIVQLHNNKPDKAVATLTLAISVAPESVMLLNTRARIYSSLGRDEEAYTDYSAMLERDSTSTAALFGRGMIALAKTNLAQAEADLSKLEVIAPESRNAHIAMATLRSLRGEYEAAEVHYTALIEEEPTDEFYLGRAVCRIMTGKLGEASEDLTEGLKLNPDNADIYAQRAILCKMTYRMSDYDMNMRIARKLGYRE